MDNTDKERMGPRTMLSLSEYDYQLLRDAMDDRISQIKARIRTADEVRDEIESGADTIHLSIYAKPLRDKLMAACNEFVDVDVNSMHRIQAEAERMDEQVAQLGWGR